MSETNQEEVLQNEDNIEYNENDLHIDQNHEEDIEAHADGENIINPESLEQEHNNQEEEENQHLDQKNEEEDFHHEEQNGNEEKDFQQEHEEQEQEQEHVEQDLGNEGQEPEHEEQELEHEGQEFEHEEQELEHEEQELEHEEQELEHEEQELEQEEQAQEEVQEEAIPVIKTQKDITEMSVKELRTELDKAISQLDFVKAQSIQEEIESRSTQDHSQFLDEYAQKFAKECKKAARNHYKEKNSLQESFTSDEIAERENMKNGFQELKSLHIDQLQKLENDLFNIYKEKMKEPIVAYDDLIERAKKTARRGDFSSAQDFQTQADYAKRDEEQKREELFKKEYKARMTALLDRQSQEISDFAFKSNNSLNKLLKSRDDHMERENEKFKREMNRIYRKTCDTITHSRYNPRDPKQQSIDPKVKPSLLNRIEDTYNDLLVKFGIQSEEGAKKPKMIAPNIRPESKMSARMQSRVEMRETEKKKKEDEHYSRSNSKMSSRAASRNGSKQASPRQSPRSNYGNNNNSRRSVLSPSKF